MLASRGATNVGSSYHAASWDHKNSEAQRRGPQTGMQSPEVGPLLGHTRVSELEQGLHGMVPRFWRRECQPSLLVSLKDSDEAGCVRVRDTVHLSGLLLAGRQKMCCHQGICWNWRSNPFFLFQLSHFPPEPSINGA